MRPVAEQSREKRWRILVMLFKGSERSGAEKEAMEGNRRPSAEKQLMRTTLPALY